MIMKGITNGAGKLLPTDLIFSLHTVTAAVH
jgi:hypothetical protein